MAQVFFGGESYWVYSPSVSILKRQLCIRSIAPVPRPLRLLPRRLPLPTAVEDLADLEEQDLLEIGMKRVEVKRLQRIAQ